jgi:hypothetical protein
MGFPLLPESGSQMHFDTIRKWIQACDETHPECASKRQWDWDTPKRLIDVGDLASPFLDHVVLLQTRPGEKYHYIALSHLWGPGPHFCTYPDDDNDNDLGAGGAQVTTTLSRHMAGIALADLPATFRDAVLTTRSLGIRYLWIDSICIVQGPRGDFPEQARKMEAIFSGADVVIAASWAAGQADGFLKTEPGKEAMRARRHRKVVRFEREGRKPVYLCEMVDDFGKHVLEGGLSRRGWVLQERALARRSVFFTERQTYWECGQGVRCETMTRMQK